MVIALVPLFVTITSVVVMVPRYTVPKLKLAGVTVRAETKFAVTVSAAFMVTVVEALVELATGPVQLEKT